MARATRRPRRKPALFRQQPWRQPVNPYAPTEVLTAEQVEDIHLAALSILRDTGLRVLSPDVRARYQDAGAVVDDDSMRVRFDPAMVEEMVAKAPSTMTLQARNPDRNIILGDKHVCFCSVGGPAFVSDLDDGRRPGTMADMENLIRLAQSLNAVHQLTDILVEPQDLPAPTRYLDTYLASIRLSDKNWRCQSFGRVMVDDAVAMLSIALQTTPDALLARPATASTVNTNSPLQLDVPMGEGLMALAEYGQPINATPFTMAGSMAPVTLAGAVALQTAEVLAMTVLAQAVRPGAPVIYGSFTLSVDFRTGAPGFGSPEFTKAAQASGQMARRYGLPLRSSNVTSSNSADAQAAYESQMSLWGAVMGGVHLLNQGAGWLEGGLTASFEKMVIDAEMLQMMAAYLDPIVVDQSTLGLDAIAEVGPGGHFFSVDHTLERYETAFYEPMLSDWSNFENWQDSGSKSATQRANTIWKQLLSDYEEPPIDPGIVEELETFVARRKTEIEAGD